MEPLLVAAADKPIMAESKRILLAEDNASDIELTLAALEESNQVDEIAVVRDGAEALDYLYRRGVHSQRPAEQPCVILLDIKMPKLGGFEVLRTVKADGQLKSLPVVMLTSSREEGDLSRCYELGVNAYVVKPVDFVQFSNVIKQLGRFWGEVNEPPPQCARRTH
jgi:CheY-like chemotaxis protein